MVKILLLYISLFSAPLLGQVTLQKQLELANNLFEDSLFFDAITEYKRLRYFDRAKEFDFISNFNIGLAYKAGAKLDDAARYFVSADLATSIKSEKYLAQTELVKVNILRKTTTTAFKLIDQMETSFPNKIDELKYWRGWVFMFDDNWEAASIQFSRIDTSHSLKLLSDRVQNDKYSVILAKGLSYIVPGAGQIYTGNYLSGVLSLAWNLATGYWTVSAITDNRVFDALMVGNLLFLRFYNGNVDNAEKFAIENNLKVSNEALLYLQKYYRGIKP
ncbi:MAG: hypothetical protein K9J12_00590 [Melioribacteraceae bacterium]|nr:hypothetical protein [Melioribacteraceae bacterium]